MREGYDVFMKHYKESPILILLNVIFEYGTMLATYLLCGFLRCHILLSFGRVFAYKDIFKFLPLALIMYALAVFLFGLKGDYSTIHIRNSQKEILWVVFVQFLCGMVGASGLYIFQGTQFSRLLLFMIIIANSVSINVKRILFSRVGESIFQRHFQAIPVLVLGNNTSAKRFVSSLEKNLNKHYKYAGYLANEENPYMSNFLGHYDTLSQVILEREVGQVIIAEGNLTEAFLEKIMATCATLNIETYIIPAFSEYLQWGQTLQYENDSYMMPLKMKKTDNILGVNIAVTDMEKTIQNISEHIEKWRGKYICVSNVHTTIMAHDDENYRKVQNDAVMALPDGGPLSSYSRSHGNVHAKRVTGPDLMRECLKRSGEFGWRHFFYGASQETLDLLQDKIKERYPDAFIAGMISPPFRDLTHEEDLHFTQAINDARPDFVWVGLGAPKQEIWMAAHKDRINALMIGVGAAFDYESDNLKRAPKWMQKCNLEWLYRLLQEPRRLFKRYFVTNIKFLWLTRR